MLNSETHTSKALFSQQRIKSLLWIAPVYLLLWMLVFASATSIWEEAYGHYSLAGEWHAKGDLKTAEPIGFFSTAYLAILYLFQIIPDLPSALVLYLTGIFCGGIMLMLMEQLLLIPAGKNHKLKLALRAYGALVLCLNAWPLTVLLSSGSPIILSMVWLAAYLYLFKRFEHNLSPGKSLLLGLWGGLALFIQPELLLFSIVCPLVLALAAHRKLIRSQAVYILLFTFFTLLVQTMATQQLWGDFWPGKGSSGTALTEDIEAKYAWSVSINLLSFVALNLLPLGLIAWGMMKHFAKWKNFFSHTDKALVVATAFLLLYFLFFGKSTENHVYRQYYLAFPALIYLSARSGVFLLRVYPEWKTVAYWQEKKKQLLAGAIVLAGILLAYGFLQEKPEKPLQAIGHFRAQQAYNLGKKERYPYLIRISILPEEMKIVTPEPYFHQSLNPDKRIIALSTLSPVAKKLEMLQPDLIYIPDNSFAHFHRELSQAAYFQSEYLYFSAEKLEKENGIAIYRNSPYYFHLVQIIEEESGVQVE